VLLVHEWVETGAHIKAAQLLIEGCDAVLVGCATVVDDCRDIAIHRALNVVGVVRSSELPPG
jgi:riboflavin biosynthesis pyrimidine reductase